MKQVDTKLSVDDISLFTLFLSANDMAEVEVLHYSVPSGFMKYRVDNYIRYKYDDSAPYMMSMDYIILKYSSIENAFLDFKQKTRQLLYLDTI